MYVQQSFLSSVLISTNGRKLVRVCIFVVYLGWAGGILLRYHQYKRTAAVTQQTVRRKKFKYTGSYRQLTVPRATAGLDKLRDGHYLLLT